jgi:hypothetical protein
VAPLLWIHDGTRESIDLEVEGNQQGLPILRKGDDASSSF